MSTIDTELIKIAPINEVEITTTAEIEDAWRQYWFDNLVNLNIESDPQTLGCNRNLTWEMIESKPSWRWSYTWISFNPNLTIDIIRANRDRPWEFSNLTLNKAFSFEDIVATRDEFPWDWTILSKQQPWEYIQDHPELPWNDLGLSMNNTMPPSYVFENPDRAWSYTELSKWMPWQYVSQHLDLSWNYHYLSLNPTVTWVVVSENPTLPWLFSFLSYNQNITIDIINDNPDMNWNYTNFSRNPNVSMDIIIQNPQIKWNFAMLTRNPSIQLEQIMDTIFQYKWNIRYIAIIAPIDWLLTLYNKATNNVRFDFGNVSMNHNLLFEHIWSMPYVNWDNLSLGRNPMVAARRKFIESYTIPSEQQEGP